MDHLNYFYPHSSAAPHWEVPLTRAFFALLKLCPEVHAQFIERIRCRQPGLPPFLELRPALMNVLLEQKSIPADSDWKDCIVNLTGKITEPRPPSGKTSSNRRYDAVLSYPTGYNLVVESKLYEADAKDTTANTGNEILGAVVALLWNDVIDDLWQMIDCRLLAGASAALAGQFLEYVEDKFPSLCPYSTLERCNRNESRIRRRLHLLLSELGTTESDGSEVDLGSKAIAQRAILRTSGEKGIYLGLYPGIFMKQAQRLYDKLDEDRLDRLESDAWRIRPSINLCFAATSAAGLNPSVKRPQYIEYWRPRARELRQYSDDSPGKPVFSLFFREMLEACMTSEGDRDAFDSAFVSSKRTRMSVCPGFCLEYDWSIEKAEALDREGRLKSEVARRICEGLEAWGQEPLKSIRAAAASA